MFFLPFRFIATSVKKKLKLVLPRAMILHGLFWSWWIASVSADKGKCCLYVLQCVGSERPMEAT